MGFQGDLRIDVPRDAPSDPDVGEPRATDRIKELRAKREHIRERLEKAKEAQAKYYNRGKTHREFKIGEQVMLRAKNIASLRYNEKLADRYLGPFQILDT